MAIMQRRKKAVGTLADDQIAKATAANGYNQASELESGETGSWNHAVHGRYALYNRLLKMRQ